MTKLDPELELELEKRFETKADWSAHRELSAQVEELKTWRAAQDALSTLRRWAAPILVTAIGLALNIGIAVAHAKH